MNAQTLPQFFELIRSGLWGAKADASLFEGGADWNALARIASMQSLSCIFADGTGTLPKALLPPADIVRKLYVVTEGTRRANLQLNAVLGELESMLRSEGIEGILLKGQGVARNYLVPEHRMCGDIDLYTGRDYRRSCELVRNFGEQEGREDESEKHFHFKRRGCTIEIHRYVTVSPDPFKNRRLQAWADSQLGDPSKLRSAEIGGSMINLPPVSFDSVFLLHHIAGHLIKGGIGLRQLCDWCRHLHVHAAEIDRVALERDLRSLGLMNCWQLMGWLAVNRLGLPEEEMPFYSAAHGRKALRCLGIILRKGNFGHYDKAARRNTDIHFVLRKIQSCFIVVKQEAELLTIIPSEVLRYLPWYLLDGIRRVFTNK